MHMCTGYGRRYDIVTLNNNFLFTKSRGAIPRVRLYDYREIR